MATIRRFYLYGVLFVSLVAVLIGAAGVLSVLLAGTARAPSALALPISQVLVGIPIFLIHWWLEKRSVFRDAEEASARTRAVFLYAVLLAALVPALLNGMALAERAFLALFDLPTFRGAILAGNTWQESVANIIVVLTSGGYFYLVVRRIWEGKTGFREPLEVGDAFRETRRLYRYIWLVIGLAWLLMGLINLLSFLLSLPGGFERMRLSQLAEALAWLAGGAPVWVYWERRIQRSLGATRERYASLRLVLLYGFVFSGAVLLLFFVNDALRQIFLAPLESIGWSYLAASLSWVLSLAPFWVYYLRKLKNTITVHGTPPPPEQGTPETTVPSRRSTYLPRQAALNRIITYFLAFTGLVAASLGLAALFAGLIELLFGDMAQQGLSILERLNEGRASRDLAQGLAYLLTGLPLWLVPWNMARKEAAPEGEVGDHARRSLVRKVYLYLFLFIGVIGAMLSGGRLIFLLIQAALSQSGDQMLPNLLHMLRLLLIFSLLGVYHWLALRQDQRLSEKALARRHAQFPVLILAPEGPKEEAGENGTAVVFSEVLMAALQRRAPSLPVAVHPAAQGAPDETLSAARAVILPAELMVRQPEGLRLWLQNYPGTRLVIPTATRSWFWVFPQPRSLEGLARQAANFVGRLAEGEEIQPEGGSSTWQVAANILAALFILEILFLIFLMFVNILGL